MLLLTPHHKPAAKAHHPILDVDHPCLAPRLEEAVHRPAAVESFDVRTQKATGFPPGPAAEHESRTRHQGARVKPPAHPPQQAGWNVEVKADHGAARTEHAAQLSHGSRGVGDIAQQVREADRVERSRWKWQLLGSRMLQPDPAIEAGGVNPFPPNL